MKKIDRAGHRYGSLVVVEAAEKKTHGQYWLCRCDCGTEKSVHGSHLAAGKIVSCGCHKNQKARDRATHGMTRTPLYRVWKLMRQRCHYSKNNHFHTYGGRGIKVCPEWHDFQVFYRDMGELYHAHVKEFGQGDTQIDRINNDGDYCKENCRWVTRIENARNTRRNRFIEYKGITKTLAEWEQELGLPENTLAVRLNRLGWPIERAITTPINAKLSTAMRSGWKKKKEQLACQP